DQMINAGRSKKPKQESRQVIRATAPRSSAKCFHLSGGDSAENGPALHDGPNEKSQMPFVKRTCTTSNWKQMLELQSKLRRHYLMLEIGVHRLDPQLLNFFSPCLNFTGFVLRLPQT